MSRTSSSCSVTSTTPSPTILFPPLASSSPPSEPPAASTTSLPPSGYSRVCPTTSRNYKEEDHEHETNTTYTGINAKVENKGQYDEYLTELQGIREELGVVLKEDLFPTSS